MAGPLTRNRVLAVAAYLFVVGMFTFGLLRLAGMQHDQCQAFDTFARNLGRELGADDRQIRDFIDQFHDDLEQC